MEWYVGSMLNIDEVAQRIRVSPNTVRYLRQEGRFAPAIKVGRLLYWEEADIEAWLRAQKEPA